MSKEENRKAQEIGKDTHNWMQSSRERARRDKKTFLSGQCKNIEEKFTEWERIEISSRKLEILRDYFRQR